MTTHGPIIPYIPLLSTYNAKPVPTLLMAIKHMFRYIAGTVGFKLTATDLNAQGWHASSDTDWMGLHSLTGSTKSTRGVRIDWKGFNVYGRRKWIGTKLSSAEAEAYGLSEAIKDFRHMVFVAQELGLQWDLEGTPTIYCDSQAAIAFSKAGAGKSKMRHLDMRLDSLQSWLLWMLADLDTASPGCL